MERVQANMDKEHKWSYILVMIWEPNNLSGYKVANEKDYLLSTSFKATNWGTVKWLSAARTTKICTFEEHIKVWLL